MIDDDDCIENVLERTLGIELLEGEDLDTVNSEKSKNNILKKLSRKLSQKLSQRTSRRTSIYSIKSITRKKSEVFSQNGKKNFNKESYPINKHEENFNSDSKSFRRPLKIMRFIKKLRDKRPKHFTITKKKLFK